MSVMLVPMSHTDLTVLACPVNMHGIPGAFQVLAALLYGVCTLHTSSKESAGAWVEGSFPSGH